MFYHKGKIRYLKLSGYMVYSKKTHFRIQTLQQMRFKCNILEENDKNDNTEGNIAITNTQFDLKNEIRYPDILLSIVKTPEDIQKQLNEFMQHDFSNFKELTSPHITNQKVFPQKAEYKSIKNLNQILSDNQVKKALELVRSNYKQGTYLNSIEFQSLFIQFLPFNWYAYNLVKLYESRTKLNSFDVKILALILKVSYSNFDFRLFDKIFQTYQLINDKIPFDILMSAIQVYLKTENIQIATQLFNQQVMTEPNLPNRVLDLFISNLYNQTKNINLCFSSYRLWLSKDLKTNISIDSFMYNLLLESNDLENITWIENSLKERKLFDKFPIRFGNLCNGLSKDFKSYNHFINSEAIDQYKYLAEKDNELASFLHNLTYLHLRHKKYKLALETFNKINTRKDFQLTVYSILRHFEKEQKPEVIFSVLQNLKSNSNYRIHWSHILIYWRTLIKKYPDLGFEIQKKFKKSLKKSKYHRFGFLSKLLLINKNTTFDIGFYPVVRYDSLESDLKPLPASPKLKNIESRLFAGILPNNELLRKSIKLTNDRSEFDRLVEISNRLNLNNKSQFKNIKLNIEIFYKDCLFGNKSSIRDFVNNQIETINKINFVDSNDLCELFKICVKSELFDEGKIVLSMFKTYDINIVGDQDILKFTSMYIKWCWINKDFKNLIIILEWLKVQNEFMIDKYFWKNLKNAASKNLNRIENEALNDITLNIYNNQFAESENENKNESEFLKKILPQIISYHENTLAEIREKNTERGEKIVESSRFTFGELIKWVDEDTETMFEGDW